MKPKLSIPSITFGAALSIIAANSDAQASEKDCPDVGPGLQEPVRKNVCGCLGIPVPKLMKLPHGQDSEEPAPQPPVPSTDPNSFIALGDNRRQRMISIMPDSVPEIDREMHGRHDSAKVKAKNRAARAARRVTRRRQV